MSDPTMSQFLDGTYNPINIDIDPEEGEGIRDRYTTWYLTISRHATSAQMAYWRSGFFHALAAIYGDDIADEFLQQFLDAPEAQ